MTKAVVFPSSVDNHLDYERIHCIAHVYRGSRVPVVREVWFPADVTFDQVRKALEEKFAVEDTYFQLPLFLDEDGGELHVADWY